MESTPIYKTAEYLGIQEITRQGLIRLARDLADGTIPSELFDMKHWCGTACCIGGHLAHRNQLPGAQWLASGGNMRSWGNYSMHPTLRALFFPQAEALVHSTRSQAAQAIINFLVTGDPAWDRVMSEPAQP